MRASDYFAAAVSDDVARLKQLLAATGDTEAASIKDALALKNAGGVSLFELCRERRAYKCIDLLKAGQVEQAAKRTSWPGAPAPGSPDEKRRAHRLDKLLRGLAAADDVAGMQRAIAVGAKIGSRDPLGRTPIYLAAREGRTTAVKFLITEGEFAVVPQTRSSVAHSRPTARAPVSAARQRQFGV